MKRITFVVAIFASSHFSNSQLIGSQTYSYDGVSQKYTSDEITVAIEHESEEEFKIEIFDVNNESQIEFTDYSLEGKNPELIGVKLRRQCDADYLYISLLQNTPKYADLKRNLISTYVL